MNRIIQFTIFLLLFLTIYTTLHYYIFFRLTTLLGIKRNLVFHIVVLSFALSFPLTAFIENRLPNLLTRVLYTMSATWMGIGFFILCSLAIYEVLKLFTNFSPRAAGIAILIIALILSTYSIINGFFIDVKEVQVPLDNLNKEMKLVQISDIHLGTIRNSGFLRKVLTKISELKPDAVLITGDLIDGAAPLHEGMFDVLGQINAPIFFVTGNHENYEGMDNVLRLLNQTKIKILRNEAVEFDGVQFIGVDYSTDKKYLKNALSGINIDKNKPSILLHHNPAGLKDAKEAGIDLQLSGHMHKGQIFPFSLIVKLAQPYIYGLYNIDGMYLYVSSGTGTWGPPMRLGSRNEITVINLIK